MSLGALKEGMAIGTHAPHSYKEVGRDAWFPLLCHAEVSQLPVLGIFRLAFQSPLFIIQHLIDLPDEF